VKRALRHPRLGHRLPRRTGPVRAPGRGDPERLRAINRVRLQSLGQAPSCQGNRFTGPVRPFDLRAISAVRVVYLCVPSLPPASTRPAIALRSTVGAAGSIFSTACLGNGNFGARAASAEAASGVNSGTSSLVYTSGHYILLPLRYEKRRGRHLGNRQLLGLRALRKLAVLRRPYLGIC
jgi:hypothetical protein